MTHGAKATAMNQNKDGKVMPAVSNRLRRRNPHVGVGDDSDVSGVDLGDR